MRQPSQIWLEGLWPRGAFTVSTAEKNDLHLSLTHSCLVRHHLTGGEVATTTITVQQQKKQHRVSNVCGSIT